MLALFAFSANSFNLSCSNQLGSGRVHYDLEHEN